MSGSYTETVAETTDETGDSLKLLCKDDGSGYHCLRGSGFFGLETEIRGFHGVEVEDNCIRFYRLIAAEGQWCGRVERDPRVVELLVEGGLVDGDGVLDLQEER